MREEVEAKKVLVHCESETMRGIKYRNFPRFSEVNEFVSYCVASVISQGHCMITRGVKLENEDVWVTGGGYQTTLHILVDKGNADEKEFLYILKPLVMKKRTSPKVRPCHVKR